MTKKLSYLLAILALGLVIGLGAVGVSQAEPVSSGIEAAMTQDWAQNTMHNAYDGHGGGHGGGHW